VAYGRWWEARLTWGVVVNSSRALASQAAATMKTHAHLTQLITELLAFVVTLKSLLRCRPTVREELGTMLSHEQLNVLNEAACPPIAAVEALAHTLRTGVRTSDEGGLLAGCTYLHLSGSLNDLVNAVGACERLQTTPMPYGYVAALRCFLLLWLVTLPFTLISTFAWWSTPMVSIVAFLFFNLEQMAMEIEQPFGDDPNDLPLEEFCLRVERVLLDILRRALKPGSEGEEGGDKGRSGQPRQPDEALEARAVSSL
jgi:putative membrane protein